MASARVRRVDAAGDMMFGRGQSSYLSGTEATAQRVRSALRLILGEVFYDTSVGVPTLPNVNADRPPILGERPNLSYARAVFTDAILGVDSVASIDSLEMTVDTPTRGIFVEADVFDVDGNLITINEAFP
jgi:hypothetical protein